MRNVVFNKKQNDDVVVNVHIYHHDDLDGVTAAAVAYHSLDLRFKDKVNINLYSLSSRNYSEYIDISNVRFGDIVYFLDFSFSNDKSIESLRSLYTTNIIVVWIDHHRSSIESIEANPWMKNIRGIIVDGICGAMLTYIYFNPDKFFDISLDKEAEILLRRDVDKYINIANDLNEYIAYVNDHDIFRNRLDNTREFSIGAFHLYSDPKCEVLRDALCISQDTSWIVDRSIEIGSTIVEYESNVDKNHMKGFSYECSIDYNGNHYNCICINRRGNSYTFGEAFDTYDICILFYFNGEKYYYSLYSKNIDSSLISTYFGGGGHMKASGFSSDELIFKKDSNITIP